MGKYHTDFDPPHVENYEDYHLTEAMADKAITWMRRHRRHEPGSTFPDVVDTGRRSRSRIMSPKSWADKYQGKFKDGWDAYQQRIFERQKKPCGWIPGRHEACRRVPEEMPAWEDLPEDERAFQERLMEVFAGFMEHTDVQVGKLIDELENPRTSATTRWSSIFCRTTGPRPRA